MEDFGDYLGDLFGHPYTLEQITSLNARNIRSWLASRRKRNISSRSNSRCLSVLRSFMRYIKKRYDVKNNRIEHVRVHNICKNLPRSLSVDMTNRAITGIETIDDSDTWILARDYAIMQLLYCCGLRISEALSITRQNLYSNEQQECYKLAILGKGNKERILPLLVGVSEAIKVYFTLCPFEIGDNSVIFLGKRGKGLNPDVFRSRIRKLRTLLNLPKNTTPHTFRHSFASHMLANGADIRVIQDLLGHSNIESTQIYTDIEISHLIEKYNAFHPRGD